MTRKTIRLAGWTTAVLAIAGCRQSPIYRDPKQPVEARVNDLLPRLTMDEKLSLVHGDSQFTSAAIPRLGIARRWMSDGPHGVREQIQSDNWRAANRTDDFCTALPCDLALAATWDPTLAVQYGEVIGQEARARGKQIMLGPAINIQRTPLCGRNFEYMGEDPYLTSRIAVGYINGEQSQGVASCVKHFALNNQETDRGTINVLADERTLREIYLPAFEAAVKSSRVMCVMGSYNEFRGQHCCENDYLLNQILKGEWGFDGAVISDWGGVHDTREAAMNGMDLEMGTKGPYEKFFLANPYRDGLLSGAFPMSTLDDKARRNLRVVVKTHLLDTDGPTGSINTPAHQIAARQIAEQSLVLLKNEKQALPLDSTQMKSIAVIGGNAVHLFCHEGGSAELKALYEVTPLAGIVKRVGNSADVTFSEGYIQPPTLPQRRRATTTASGMPEQRPTTAAFAAATEQAATTQEAAAGDVIDRAVKAAKNADVAIVIAGTNHSWNFDTEASDRKDIRLPFNQDELIEKVAAANPHTIVVIISGGAVEMPWLDRVPAVVEAWYPGMENGNALAAALFGDINPSGKLPCSFPKHLYDSPAHALDAYPGEDGVETYKEGLLVGYRWFDTKQIDPLFCFGHGLSYTSFAYANAKVSTATSAPMTLPTTPQTAQPTAPCTVEFDLTNTGQRDGAEVAQVYVEEINPSVPRPMKELKGFRKVALTAGETAHVTLPLDARAFAHYDPDSKRWIADKGRYKLHIGSSSRDERLSAEIELDEMRVVP